MWALLDALEEREIYEVYEKYQMAATTACWVMAPHLKKGSNIKPRDLIGTFESYRQRVKEAKKPKPGIEELKKLAKKKGLKTPE